MKDYCELKAQKVHITYSIWPIIIADGGNGGDGDGAGGDEGGEGDGDDDDDGDNDSKEITVP